MNKELVADIEIDDISLWNPSGIKLYGVRLITAGDTLANVPVLTVNINYEPLLENKIIVNRLILDKPKIRILRSMQDSIWNYDKIAFPSTDTTETETTNLFIKAKHIEFKNAEFIYYDSTQTFINFETMDYSHILLNEFDLVLSAEVNLSKNEFYTHIRKLRGKEIHSELDIKQFSGKFNVSPEVIYAKDLSTKLNDSEFDINVQMTSFDVFGEEKPDLNKAYFEASIKGYNIGDKEIYKFAVIPISFGTKSDIYIDAEGTLNDLDVNRLRLVTGKSDVKISGNLQNLLDIDFFEYELSLDNSEFTRSDIINTLKSLDLSGIPDYNFATAKRLYVHGFLDSVYIDLDLKTGIGDLSGKAGINYGREPMRYFANVSIKSLNPAKLAKNNSLNGKINGKINFKGSGIDLNSLNSFLVADLYDSEMFDIKFKNVNLDLNTAHSNFVVNSLKINFPDKKYVGDSETSTDENLSLSGSLNLSDIDYPEYILNLKLSEINLKKILHQNTFPDYVSADIDIDMKGFEIDNIAGKINADFEALEFDDRAFLPFNLASDLDNLDSNNRKINITSDFFNLYISGKYQLSSLIDNIALQGIYLADFIVEKVESFNPQKLLLSDTLKIVKEYKKITEYPQIDAIIKFDFNDISPINLFLDSMSIYSGIKMDLRYISESEMSSIFIDTLKIGFTDIQTPDLKIRTDDLSFKGRLISNLNDSLTKLENFVLNLDTTSSLKINDLELSNTYSAIVFDGTTAQFKIGSVLNSTIAIRSEGSVEIGFSDLILKADTLEIGYNNLLNWQLTDQMLISSSPNTIEIMQMNLNRSDGERISLSGAIRDDIAENINLLITNVPVTDFLILVDEDTRKKYSNTRFNLDSLRIRVNGDLNEPRIITAIHADSVIFSNYRLGTLNSRLIHNKTYSHGFVEIKSPALDNQKIIGIDINYLPLYLGLNPDLQRFDPDKQFDIRLKTSNMPLEIIAPFATGTKDMTGFLEANLVVEGNISEGITYSGSAKSNNARFNLENTNINYLAEIEVDFNKDKINLTKINLRNIPEDSKFGRIGRASASGFIEKSGFEVGMIDISMQADRLLVMSDATMIPMPDLYGDFIVSTDANPLRFYGTLDKPNLEGDANIIYAHLKMPLEQKRQAVRTYFTYQTIGDNVRLQSTTMRDTVSTDRNIDDKLAPSIADLINYNLTAKISGQFIVEMDMDLIGSMYAVIGTPDRSQALRYVKNRDQQEAQLFGEVVVRDQSTIKSWKQFATSGTINFPTGSIENPYLNLTASYSGTMAENDLRKQFLVRMTIKGYKDNPTINFTYFIDGVEATGSSDQINEDALYLLVMGRTKTGNTVGGNNILNEGFASGVSNFATKALSELLMNTGVINSAEFDFQGGSMNLGEATLRLSGQLYGGISWTVGGTVADLSSNNQITIDIPASEFSTNPFWSNFVLQLSKASTNNVLANSQDAKNWEVKIKLGSSW
ncbi:MAG: hypothetical protein KIT33_09610 [Candidatus Kapabacteria bacterium]|nr:hypothetical protein [Candidatus Kapabacteria bacterium]